MRFAHSETHTSEAQASGGVDSHGSSSSFQSKKKWVSGNITEVIVPQLDPPTSSDPAAAALFHKLRLVPLLPGRCGIILGFIKVYCHLHFLRHHGFGRVVHDVPMALRDRFYVGRLRQIVAGPVPLCVGKIRYASTFALFWYSSFCF